MTQKKTLGFLSALCAVLIAAALFFSGGWLLKAVSARADGADGSTEQTEKAELNFEDMLSNKIDNITYDVTFDTQGGNSYFCNTVPVHGNSIVLEADTVTSSYSSQGASYGLAREFFNNNWAGYFYEQGGAYYHYGNDNTANIFQNGKHTEVEYVPGSGPVIKVDNETKPDGTQVPGAFKSWAEADGNSLAGYFGYCSNGMAPYSATLKNFKYYDKVTNQDLGINFYGFDATVTRFAEVGKTVTVTPVTFTTLAVSGLRAIDENGVSVTLENVTDNSDGSFSFTMPATGVTVSPVYTYEGHNRLQLPDTLVSKLDNVSYLAQFSIRANGYIVNKTLTSGNITMQYYTVPNLLSYANGVLFGYVRAKDVSDYAYVGNPWYTASLPPCWPNEVATLAYDTATHAFTLKHTDTVDTGWTKNAAGGGPSNEAIDAAGAQRIGFAWNTGAFAGTFRNFKMMDGDSWDLGVDLSASAVDQTATVLQRWAETGKTVTLKSTDGRAVKSLTFVDDLGKTVSVAVTANADGTCSFTMPAENVTVKDIAYAVEASSLYGSYYNAETGNIIVLGESGSYIRKGSEKTDITAIDAATDGTLVLTATESLSATFTENAITLDGKEYTKLTSYTVTLDLNGGTGESSALTVNSGDYKVQKPADPTRTGYTFKGWKTAEGAEFDFDKTVTANVTLKAQWEKNVADSENYYGSYCNTATGDMIVLGESGSYLRIGGTKTDITSFTVYEIGEIEIVTEEGTETAAITAAAITYKNNSYSKLTSYTVTFDLDGGTGEISAVTVNSGDYTVQKPADPAKEGYTFAGWKTAAGEAFDFAKPVTGDVTLKAQWTKNGGDSSNPGNPENPGDSEKEGCGGEIVATSAIAAGALLLGTAAVLTVRKRKTR